MSGSRPPITPTSLADAVRIALSYMRASHALMSRVAPTSEQTGGLFVAITMLERALRSEEDTKRTEIPR